MERAIAKEGTKGIERAITREGTNGHERAKSAVRNNV